MLLLLLERISNFELLLGGPLPPGRPQTSLRRDPATAFPKLAKLPDLFTRMLKEKVAPSHPVFLGRAVLNRTFPMSRGLPLPEYVTTMPNSAPK